MADHGVVDVNTGRGCVLLLSATAASKKFRAAEHADSLAGLAAVPPQVLGGTSAPVDVVSLVDPVEPQAVLTHLRTAAAAPGPVVVHLVGRLTFDRKQHKPHVALAHTTPQTVRYTALPWEWLNAELGRRRPGTTTVFADLVADGEAFAHLDPVGLVGELQVWGAITPPRGRGSEPMLGYTRAMAGLLRGSRTRPRTSELHAAGRGGVGVGAVLLEPRHEVPLMDGELPGANGLGGVLAAAFAPGVPAAETTAGGSAATGSMPAVPAAPGPVPGSTPPAAAPVLTPPAVPPAVAAPVAPPTAPPAPTPTPPQSAPAAPAPAVPPAPPPPTAASAPTPPAATRPPATHPAPNAPVPNAPVPNPAASAQPAPNSPAPAQPVPNSPVPAQPVPNSPVPDQPAPTPPPVTTPTPASVTPPAGTPVPPPAAPPPAPPPPAPRPAAAHDPREAIGQALRAHRYTEAASLAASWEQYALRTHGPSSMEMVHVTEAQAQIAYECGELARAADRWILAARGRLAWHSPDHPEAVSAVDNAHHVWQRLEDTAVALRLAPQLLELRREVPGASGQALRALERRLETLVPGTFPQAG
jgi:hypothetical protein